MNFSEKKESKLSNKYDTINLILETYNYDVWFENEESTDKEELTDREEWTDKKICRCIWHTTTRR